VAFDIVTYNRYNERIFIPVESSGSGGGGGGNPFSDATPLVRYRNDSTSTVTLLADNVPNSTNVNLFTPSVSGTLLLSETITNGSGLTWDSSNRRYNLGGTLSSSTTINGGNNDINFGTLAGDLTGFRSIITNSGSGGLFRVNGNGFSFPSGTSGIRLIVGSDAQGDIYFYDGTILSRVPKSATATRYLANTAASNNPQWDQVNLSNGVTSRLPYANLTAATAASKLFGRQSGSAGDWQEITLGTGLSMSGATLNATGYSGPSSGTPGDMLRWDVTGNALENFTPTANPTTTDGDLIQQSGGVLARLAAVATGNVLISGGVGTINSWGKVGLTTHVSGRLPFANFTQGSALSVLGVTGNAIADFASIAAGTDGNVLRRSGTSLTFGSLDLSAAGTVGSSVLPVANGGTGVSTGAWLLASGGALSANNSITGAFNLTFSNARFSRTGTYTATANNDFMFQYTGTFTGRATASDTFRAFDLTPTLVSGAATQNGIAFRVAPTFTTTGGAFATAYVAQLVGTAGSVIVNSTGALVTDRGLSFDISSSAGANVLNFATGNGAQITASSTNNQLTFAGGSSTQGNAASSRFFYSHTFAPVSGSTNTAVARFQQTINQTGTANGVTTLIDYVLTPTAMVGNHTMLNITSSSGITLANTLTGIDYNPTITSVTTHYAALFRSGRVGIGTATPTATLHIGAGSASASTAPLKFTSGSLMSTAEAGAFEFLTDKFYATITTGAARKELTLNDAALTSGLIPVATTNGRITNSLATIDGNGTFSNSNAAGTRMLFFDTTSATQTIYSVTISGSVPNMLLKASNGISGSVTGADIIIQSGDAFGTGNNNSGNLYLNIGLPNGSGVNGNIGLFTTSGSFGSGSKVTFIANASVVPSTNPSGGGIIYVELGALKYIGSSGTITTLGPA